MKIIQDKGKIFLESTTTSRSPVSSEDLEKEIENLKKTLLEKKKFLEKVKELEDEYNKNN